MKLPFTNNLLVKFKWLLFQFLVITMIIIIKIMFHYLLQFTFNIIMEFHLIKLIHHK